MSIIEALNDLKDKFFGQADFVVLADGTIVHDVTVFTKSLDGRQPEQFFAEAAQDGTIRPGDRLQVPSNKGRFDIVRIIRPGRASK